MYPPIPWELSVDPLGSLGTAALEECPCTERQRIPSNRNCDFYSSLSQLYQWCASCGPHLRRKWPVEPLFPSNAHEHQSYI